MNSSASAKAPPTGTSLFDFKGHPVRVVEIDGDPWFVAADVCRVLALDNPNYVTGRLSGNEKASLKLANQRGGPVIIISESGLYKLVLRSDKPEAKEFQDWVTKIILPAIRKDGGYIKGEEKVSNGTMSEDELVLRAISIPSSKMLCVD